jgi:berberine-like enzyme
MGGLTRLAAILCSSATRQRGEPVDARATAFSHRGALCEWGCLSSWLDPAADDMNTRWTRALSEVMRPFTTGSDYVNQIGLETDEGSERIKAAFEVNYDRLVALKNKYDPTKVFPRNQNIRPTGPGTALQGSARNTQRFRFAGGGTSSALTRLGKSSQHAVASFEWRYKHYFASDAAAPSDVSRLPQLRTVAVRRAVSNWLIVFDLLIIRSRSAVLAAEEALDPRQGFILSTSPVTRRRARVSKFV